MKLLKTKKLFLFIVFILFIKIPKSYSETFGGWKAGMAKAAITPEQPMWMAGYAARTKPAEGKLHDLWAKALFLEDSLGNSALLITSDLVGFTKNISDRIRNDIQEKIGLSKAQIILNSSHTHSGPELIGNDFKYTYSRYADQINQTDGKYFKKSEEYSYWLVDQIVKLAVSAKRSMQPVNIYSANGIVRFQVNRRNNKESELTSFTELKGPNDYSVPVLKVEDKKGEIKAIVFGYACHATVLDGYQWSGDYPGFAQLELEEKYKDATAMFFQGAGGDQNPLPRRTIPLAKQYGQELAAAVERVLSEDMAPLSPILKTAYSEINLEFAKSGLTVKDQLKAVIESPNYPDYLKRNAKFVLDKLEEGKNLNTSFYPYPVQVWRIGEQHIIALGGELTVGYAIRFKQIFGEDIFVLGYSNDVMSYIPTTKILKEGGYEGTGSPLFPILWASDIEEVIVNEVSRLFYEVSIPEGMENDLLTFVDPFGERKPVKTFAEWGIKRRQILDRFQMAAGELPDTTNLPPFNVHFIDSLTEDHYTRYTISFTAAENETIPAYLYVPTQRTKTKFPAMLALHPTGILGKKIIDGQGDSTNRAYAKELAQRGYVVIAPDYPSFGDLKNYDFANDRYQSGTMKGIFNHMRCVDLLQSLNYVDPTRIGVIGHSLGGHNAIFVGAFDKRLKVIVSSCGWTLLDYYDIGEAAKKYGGRLGPWAQERYMPLFREKYSLESDKIPFDFDELIAILVPRGFFSNSPLDDTNFNVEGVKKGIRRVSEVYHFFRAGDKLRVRYPKTGHDFPEEIREEAYQFIDFVLKHHPHI